MQEELILKALEELKATTLEISRMLQVILYNIYNPDDEDDNPATHLHQTRANLIEEEDFEEKYRRTYFG